jgi:hypothetical protein
VATLTAGHARSMFMISTAFTAVLMTPLGAESGGTYIWRFI